MSTINASLIAATGTAHVRVPPDRATLYITVRATHSTNLQQAATENSRVHRAVIAALGAAGIPVDRCVTRAYESGRMSTWNGKEHKRGDYYVAHHVAVEVHDLLQLGGLITVARQAGAAHIAGPSFWLVDDEAVRAQATALAVVQARTRAHGMAAAASQTLGRLVRLGTPDALKATLFGGSEADYSAPSEGARGFAESKAESEEEVLDPLIYPVPIVVSAAVHGAWEIA